MSEPTSLRAGDSVDWSVDLPGYSAADGWTLSYRLIFPTGTSVTLPGTGSGTEWRVTRTSTDTAAWPAGPATLVPFVEKPGGIRVTLAQQQVTILPDLHTASAVDSRSSAVQTLAALEAALAEMIAGGTGTVASATVNGRTTQFRDTKSLIELINYYRTRVAEERAASAVLFGQSPGRVMTRM